MNPPISAQYRHHFPQQRSPHAVAARRGPGPMISSSHPQAALTPAQAQAQHAAAIQELEQAKRRSRRPIDKDMPEGVEDVTIGDGVQRYMDLRNLERRLDAATMRKKLDIQDAVNRNLKKHKTLRIWIWNTAENQPWQGGDLDENAFDFNTGVEATYRVKIQGRLLDDHEDDDLFGTGSTADDFFHPHHSKDVVDHDGGISYRANAFKPNHSHRTPPCPTRSKLSHFFKSITIDIDGSKNLHPDGVTPIEWKKPPVPSSTTVLPPAADFDLLEFERKSDENINCTINLFRDESPERYRLSEEVASLLDTPEDDRAGVVMGIWEYVRVMGLQEDQERRGIRCDDRLRAIFQQDTLFFPQVPDLLLHQNHLLPLLPIALPYTIRVDAAWNSTASPTPTIYDILVPLPDPLRTSMSQLLTSSTYPSTLRTIATHDEQLALLVQKITHGKAKHAFLQGLARDPQGFLTRWIASQRRDLEVILGESARGGEGGEGEEWRRGGDNGVWAGEEVRESVSLWLARGR